MATYELLRSLDRGGMAEVFLARLQGVEGFEKRVVLKRVLPHLSGDARFLERFFAEAQLAASLSHPNIVQIFELGEQNGQHFIAMEHVDGRNLRELSRRLAARDERIPIEHALRIGAFVLDALHYAHTRRDERGHPLGLVHRDVSLSNVLVSFEGVVKLIDFGIAKTFGPEERTNPGTVVGKAGYMSPEQTRGGQVDARSDVFSLAVTLYHLLTGQLPFPGTGAADVMRAIATGQRRPADEDEGLLDDALSRILRMGFAHEPSERFESALGMQAALERYLSGRGLWSNTALLGELMRGAFEEEPAFPAAADEEPETESRLVTLAASSFSSDEDRGTFTALPEGAVAREAPPPRRRSAGLVVIGGLAAAAAAAGALLWPGSDERVPRLLATTGQPAAEAVPRVVEEPVVEEPVVDEPVIEEPVVEEPVIEEPVAEEPVVEEPAVEEPVVKREPPVRKRPSPRRQPPEPPKRRAAVEQRAAASLAPAKLTLDSEPWSEVSVDGRVVGLTPLHALELPAGRHRLRFVNADEGLKKELTLKLRPGEARRLRVKLP